MRRTLALLLSLLAPSPAPAGGPESPGAAGRRPTFEATSTLPASRSTSYDASNLGDGDPATAWCENAVGLGQGEAITARLPSPASGRAVHVTIRNGYQKSDATLAGNGAPGDVVATVLEPGDRAKVQQVVRLQRSREPQRFTLDVPEGTAIAAVRFTILSAFPGSRYEDSCVSELDVAVGAAPATPAPPGPIPLRLSAFAGWGGFRVDRRSDGTAELVFPREFGHENPGELAVVAGMIEGVVSVDLDMTPAVPASYAAMAQLRRLAVELQDRAAAEAILHADTKAGMDLGGGELSEMYGPELLAPMVAGYRDLGRLLTPALEDRVAEVVCASSLIGEVDEASVVKALEARKLRSLAAKVRRACAAER